MTSRLDRAVADAILGLDTLFGGDVANPSGTGRFIADAWFSNEPLPEAYAGPLAAAVRGGGGVSAGEPDRAAIESYLRDLDLPGAIAGVADGGREIGGLRGRYLEGLAASCGVMWDLALELLGRGEPVAYSRAVEASCGVSPSPSQPQAKRERVRALLDAAGYDGDLPSAVERWRRDRLVPRKSIPALARAFIAELDAASARHLLPYLPTALQGVPRANVTFLPIENAWFSGSMNYLGQRRQSDGSPEYEATYELNAALEISVPEFAQLVAHEVVPGHVTTFAYLQHLYWTGAVGFEASVPTMNTRAATLSEGIANNAILISRGITEIAEPRGSGPRTGTAARLAAGRCQESGLLADLAGGLAEGRGRRASAARVPGLHRTRRQTLRRLGPPSAARPHVSALLPRRDREDRRVAPAIHAPEKLLPAIYGAQGLVDIVTVDAVLVG